MGFLREIRINEVEADVKAIQNTAERSHPKSRPERKSITKVAGIDNPSFLTIVDTNIEINYEFLTEVDDIDEIKCTVDFGLQDAQVTVKVPNNIVRKSLDIFKFTPSDQDANILLKEIKLITAKSVLSSSVVQTDRPVLHFSVKNGILKASIQYKVKVVESLILEFSNNIVTSVSSLLSEYIDKKAEDSIVEFTPKIFYDTVTEKTQLFSGNTPNMVVDGLEVDLLPFQNKAVNWLLSREGVQYDKNTHSAHPIETKELDLQSRLDSLSLGFVPIQLPFYDEIIWFNRYSGNICSNSRALEFLKNFTTTQGKGLLSEEMGLGKTIEILALSNLNKREKSTEDVFLDHETQRTIRRAKTTLIICPESLLSQWIEETETHAPLLKVMVYKGISNHPNMSSLQLAELLSTYDIVVTSYNYIQREVHYASYDPSRTKRLRETTTNTKSSRPKLDSVYFNESDVEQLDEFYRNIGASLPSLGITYERYTSPLVLVEFWRLVLDEVQMVASTSTNIYKISNMIPRVHSWGVSGTPIRNQINDLSALVSFLRIHPFSNNTTWKSLMKNKSGDAMRLFSSICFRHTKEMVKNDIELPPQQKILLSIPFGPVEQDNYNSLFATFLHEVKLDPRGAPTVDDWEENSKYHDLMRRWLRILRRVCSHANLGHEHISTDLGYTSFGYDTIEMVLQSMIRDTQDNVLDAERAISMNDIRIGQFLESRKAIDTALEVWTKVCEATEARITNLRKEVNESPTEKNATALRLNLDLLHRCYFFIGSAHFQKSYSDILSLVGTIPAGFTDEYFEDYLYNSNVDPTSSDIVVHKAFSEEEARHNALEDQFYDKARVIRNELLSESMSAVEEYLQKINPVYQIPIFDILEHPAFRQAKVHDLSSLEVDVFVSNIKTAFMRIIIATQISNKWLEELVKLLSTPLFDSRDSMPSEEDYKDSIAEQRKIEVYLDYLKDLGNIRNSLLNGGEVQPPPSRLGRDSDEISFMETLDSQMPSRSIGQPLRLLLVQSKTLLNVEVVDYEVLADLILTLKESFEAQVKAKESFNRYYRLLNDLYNRKITYFKQLQKISDSLISPSSIHYYKTEAEIERLTFNNLKQSKNIDGYRSRIRYLKSLSSSSDIDKECVICRSEIRVGSLVKCGHRYCKDCLKEWLSTVGVKKDCPMCNETINIKEVYDFTLNKDKITANMLFEDDQVKDANQGEIFEIYHKLDENVLNSINSIMIPHNYGSKINTIVRQILWLKSKDSEVQILIYSQWTRMLHIIAKALGQCQIKFLGSQNFNNIQKTGNSNWKESVNEFKKDSSVTCFLLNAKVDASGLNLINATHVFICEPLIQTALEQQAISRIHRIGQKKPTTVWMFSITGSVEEGVMLMTTRKKLKEKEQLESEDLSKVTISLVKKGGEVVENDDLWSSFFSAKSR